MLNWRVHVAVPVCLPRTGYLGTCCLPRTGYLGTGCAAWWLAAWLGGLLGLGLVCYACTMVEFLSVTFRHSRDRVGLLTSFPYLLTCFTQFSYRGSRSAGQRGNYNIVNVMFSSPCFVSIFISLFDISHSPLNFREHSRAYLRTPPHTPAHVCTLLQVLMHKYQWENDKSPLFYSFQVQGFLGPQIYLVHTNHPISSATLYSVALLPQFIR